MTVTQTLQGEAQATIWATLNPGGTLDSVLSQLGILGVFDEVRENQQFDYISFGPTIELPNNYLNKQRGYDLVIQLDIWSRKPGFLTAQQVLARLNQLLDQQTLVLATQKCILCSYQGSQQLRDPDEFATRHIPVKYKISATET
jgi:hypothetical protein